MVKTTLSGRRSDNLRPKGFSFSSVSYILHSKPELNFPAFLENPLVFLDFHRLL